MNDIPAFSEEVATNGYRWWYVDAESDDGKHAITIILFVGSVFSPYYAHARRQGRGDPNDYCALNVALYGQTKRWAMTERSAQGVQRSAQQYDLHRSRVRLDGNQLTYDINEWTVPIPRKLVGRVSVELPSRSPAPVAIDSESEHFWQSLAPKTRIHVDMKQPDLTWSGTAYLDSNFGHRALEDSFQSWHWSRAHLNDGSTVVQYDTNELSGVNTLNTWQIQDGLAQPFKHLETRKPLKTTSIWRIHRSTRVEKNTAIEQLETLEDTPFYARSRYRTQISEQPAVCMHESLDLTRFSSRWVQCLLPFRMPRRRGASHHQWMTEHA